MKRKNIMILMISLSLVLLLGSSYALLRSSKVGSNSYVINVGTLQVTFVDSETEFLNLTNMYPMSDKEGESQDKELSFMVQNTGNVDSYYDVTLEETSTNPEFKSVIRYIINKDDKGYNEPKTLGENKYIEVGGYLKPNESSSYKVKVWLDYNAGNEYMDKEFKAKVVVNSFQESEYAKDVIKSKLVKYEESSKEDFSGGLVAVNNNGDLYHEGNSEEIREYRYNGPNVNNYVTFNDEAWRIIGVFKDENGEEHVKIVRNNILNREIFPEKYIIEGTTYSIKNINITYTGVAYWDNKESGEKSNDWATAGLQYFLNTKEDATGQKGYLSTLKDNALNMIEDTKYYLGTSLNKIIDNNDGDNTFFNTPKESYMNERAVSECDGGKGPSSNTGYSLTFSDTPNCRVWANNQATWTGKVALMYPSDYGFSTQSNYWDVQMYYGAFNETTLDTSWQKNMGDRGYEWLLTPSNISKFGISYYYNGTVKSGDVVASFGVVRPTLYLKSNVKIISGTGEENSPYILSKN